jgi:hypothetical protein
MRPAETAPTCEECGMPAYCAEWVPDASAPGYTPAEAGFRLKPLCWPHKLDRLTATSRFEEIYIDGDVGRIDRDRCGGDVVCEQCGKVYYRHPQAASAPFLTVLCDGSVCKL